MLVELATWLTVFLFSYFFSVAKAAPAPAAAKTQPASNQPLASEQEIRNEQTKKSSGATGYSQPGRKEKG